MRLRPTDVPLETNESDPPVLQAARIAAVTKATKEQRT